MKDSTWTTKLKENSAKVSISGSFLLDISCVMMFLVLFGNSLLSCLLSINCYEFWPTLSFVGSIGGHDRLFVFACTAFVLAILTLNIGVSLILHQSAPVYAWVVLLIIALSASVFLVSLSVIDEINGIIFHALEGSHVFMSFSLLVFSFTWGYLVWSELSHAKLIVLASSAKQLLLLSFVLGAFTLYEWQFAETVNSNALVNETVEAVVEWTLVTLAVFTPALLARHLPEFKVTLVSSN